jgi:hypothetical protein
VALTEPQHCRSLSKRSHHRLIPSEHETTACFGNAISDARITASTLQSMKQAKRQPGLATPKSLTNPRPRIPFRSSRTTTLALPPVKESEPFTKQKDRRQTVCTTRPSHESRGSRDDLLHGHSMTTRNKAAAKQDIQPTQHNAVTEHNHLILSLIQETRSSCGS